MRKRLAVLVLLLCVACGSLAPGAMDAGNHPRLEFSEETGRWLLRFARSRLTGRVLDSGDRPHEAGVRRETLLFVTAFGGGHRLWPRPAIGRGESLVAALESALASESVTSSSDNPEPNGIDRIQIDVVDGEIVPLVGLNESGRFRQPAPEIIDPGVAGILFETPDRKIWLLPSEIVHASMFGEDANDRSALELLDRAAAHLGLEIGSWRSAGVRLSRFRTVSIVEDSSHTRALNLVRGVIPVDEVNEGSLKLAALAGGDYLVRMQKSDGSFHYSYDAAEDRVMRQEYNVVRHAGATFALFQLYASTRDPRYLDAGTRAVRFLKTLFRPARERSGVYVLDHDGKAKLGAAALGLLALTRQIELDSRSGAHPEAAQLAQFILSMQRKDGSFQSYHRVRGDEPGDSVSLYYPGEAILALASLYKATGDKRLLDSARKGADYLVGSQGKRKELPQDSWLMQALEALGQIKREKRYTDHALALAEAMLADQYQADGPTGYVGGFGPGVPRSTPAASRAEGLLAVYRMARSTGGSRAQVIAEALKAAARFQLAQQFDEQNSFFLPNASRAAGGFRASLTSMRIRIDFVQHNICSLLGLAEVLTGA